MRQERKKKQQNNSYRWAKGVACLLLGLLFAAAYLLDAQGSALHFFSEVELYLLGKGVFLLPLTLFLMAWQYFAAGQLYVLNKKTLAIVLVMLCLLGTAHHVFIPVNEELAPSTLPDGGGLIGGLLTLALHKSVGDMLTYAVLALGWLIALYLLLPVSTLWEKVQDKLTEDEITLVRPEDAAEPKQSSSSFPRKIFKEPAASVRSNEKINAADGSLQREIYNNAEFGAFTEGLQKPSAFKRILSFKNDNVYEKEPVKQELERDPVQIPEWEERRQEVILRPIINYDAPAKPAYKPVLQDDDEPELHKHTQPEQEAAAPSIIHNAYRAAEAKPAAATTANEMFTSIEKEEDERKAQPAVQIFDSADKVAEKANAVSSVPENASAQAEDGYKLPPLELLDRPTTTDPASYQTDIMDQCAVLEQTLADFKVRAKVIAVTRGPSVTRFELEPAPGVKVSSVVNLADDIALRLAAPGVRIEAPIPGKSAIGIEAPNTKNDTVCFREVVEDEAVRTAKSRLCIGLGKDISGNIIPADLAKMPHLLVAGSTGSGKSVCINTIIAGILYKARPEEVKLILVDPKVVELSNYNGIPHLLTPVVTEPKKAASALHWAVAEMERRYKAFAESHVREIKSYNEQAQEKMPFIVIIIDELSDLMMVAKVDVEDAILRLAQKARAAGIHLILATQRPSVDVITGIVKANIPSRIAFAVSSQTDSRTIIDMGGAEKLLGKGDMLFYPIGFNKPVRVQGAFVSDAELNKIVDFIVKQSIPVNYSEEVTAQELECDGKNNNSDESSQNTAGEDELFEDALGLVLDMGQVSSSMLQRRFRIGYNRAARLVDTMEELGIVGQSVGSKPREVIMSRQEAEERFLRHD